VDSDGERSPGTGGPQVDRGVVGTVTEVLPSALYRVRLDEARQPIVAHIADRMDRNFVRILVGDRVRVELSPVDVGRGRIVAKIS
jgi:translation initiation factor IF-1